MEGIINLFEMFKNANEEMLRNNLNNQFINTKTLESGQINIHKNELELLLKINKLISNYNHQKEIINLKNEIIKEKEKYISILERLNKHA